MSVPPVSGPAPAADEHRSLRRERLAIAAIVVPLLTAGVAFRFIHLGSIPGVSGDEGWWGVQSLAWLAGRPYEAHTTSGNPIDLFFLIPVGLLHAIAPPSFFVLRTVPALVNVLALPIGFWFVRRIYGRTTAWIHTVALATLPTAIAHSRICQDPSQSIFWTSVVIYLSLLGFAASSRAWLCLAAASGVFAVALWTHPTNVFAGAFLLLPLVSVVRRRMPGSRRGRVIVLVFAAAAIVLAVVVAALAVSRFAVSNPYLARSLASASARLVDGAQWFEFAANNARLFNGITIYHYFSGARPATALYDIAFVVVVLILLWGLLTKPAALRDPRDYALMAACAVMWTGFYVFAGPKALRPHAERWGLCLIAPAALLLSRGLAGWIDTRPRLRWPAIAAAALLATSVLGSFYVNYFNAFLTTGGRSHLAYVTAAVEPKQQALEKILAMSGVDDGVTIVTQQWWLYWPIAYLATPHTGVAVNTGALDERAPDVQQSLRSGRLFFVEFAGTPELTRAIEWVGQRGRRAAQTPVYDASGRELIEILQVSGDH